MGQDLVHTYPSAAELFKKADQTLARDLSGTMFHGPPESLTRTGNCQPALYLHGLALLTVLQEKLPQLTPAATAGLSLGEFTAHAAAGTFSFEEGLRLVARRGELMDEACDATPGAMAAMIGGSEEDVRRLAFDCAVDVANLNCPGQIVLSGTEEGITTAVSKAKEYGLRMGKKLPVAGAYHSRLMTGARERFAEDLATASLKVPRVPVLSNFHAAPQESPETIRQSLEEQVTGSVRWVESMQLLLDQGHRSFVELGPGKVLAGFMARIDKSITVHSVEDVPTLEAAFAELS